jgi:hypothetical protein
LQTEKSNERRVVVERSIDLILRQCIKNPISPEFTESHAEDRDDLGPDAAVEITICPRWPLPGRFLRPSASLVKRCPVAK